MPTFDQTDKEILKKSVALWDAREGIRVGDFVEMPDGSLRRFTHDWGDGIQTTSGFQPGDQSFYFSDGYMDFSGSLDPCILKTKIVDTGKMIDGNVWFFHHGQVQAHNGVHAQVPCRVYEVVP